MTLNYLMYFKETIERNDDESSLSEKWPSHLCKRQCLTKKTLKIGQLSDVFYSLMQYIEDEVKGLMYGRAVSSMT